MKCNTYKLGCISLTFEDEFLYFKKNINILMIDQWLKFPDCDQLLYV